MRTDINKFIVSDTEICGGTPTFKGYRIMVSTVLELLGAGISLDEIRKDYYPQLTKEAIFSVFNYTSKLLENELTH